MRQPSDSPRSIAAMRRTEDDVPLGRGIASVEIGVTDLDRSLELYVGSLGASIVDDAPPGATWLRSGAAVLRLVEVDPDGSPGGWSPDDLQRGLRHIGFKVGDVDRQAERLRDAGVGFTLEPVDAVGGVRIAFFTDPDGTLLEIVEGHLDYDEVWSQRHADDERRASQQRRADAVPTLDHVAITVGELQTALSLYADGLGFEPIGRLDHAADPRGFTISYLDGGGAVLEIFSFTTPTEPSGWSPDPNRTGLRAVGLAVADPAQTDARLRERGATPIEPPGQDPHQLIAGDGVPFRLERVGSPA